MDQGQGNGAGEAAGGTRSIERAIALLLLAGRAGADGARLSDLVTRSSLPKPTVRRVLLALVRAGLLDQDAETRRYHIGPEAYVLGLLAGRRFGIHALSLDGLARLARESGDTAFLSVPRDDFAVCLHREEGAFPIRTHVLQAGDRHPLGIGAGSLAMLAALPDGERDAVLARNAALLASDYPGHTPDLLRSLAEEARTRGYAVNPGLVMPGSWGIGVAIPGPEGRPVGALSIAAIESRLQEDRQRLLAPLLLREAERLAAALAGPAAPPVRGTAKARALASRS
ncbi:MAG: transcriptional regulator [Rhizobiales bacterium 17-65-6]|nr:MAG: transcriptional regulator [Rhizobiales bacterium 12-68-15]OYZ98951.1 MAG: transcriptional regulator [Rhizobiales bacterium 17-65-6]